MSCWAGRDDSRIEGAIEDEVKVTVIATGFVNDIQPAEEEEDEPVYEDERAAIRRLAPVRTGSDGLPALDTELPTFLRRSVPAR